MSDIGPQGGGISAGVLKTPHIIKTITSLLLLTDLEKILRFENGADVSYTIPLEATLSVPLWSWVQFYRTDILFEVSILREGGVQFEGALPGANVNFKIDQTQGYFGFIQKIAVNTWLYSGAVKIF